MAREPQPIRVVPDHQAAPSPWRLGGLSVRELAVRVWNEIGEDEIVDRAAALSYYFVFALFPMVLFLAALIGLIPNVRLMEALIGYLAEALPPDAASVTTRVLREILEGAHGGLLSVGALAALWAASNGMGSIMTALNAAYDVQDARPWWKRRLLAVGLTVVFAGFTLTALILLVLGPEIAATLARHIGLGSVFTMAWTVLRWPAALILALVGVSLVYYLAPWVRQPFSWVTPGSVVAVAGWLLASAGLRLYVTRFSDYNATYGSIGGAILLLLWLYLTSVALLVGAEINAEIAKAARSRARAVPDRERRTA
jgi:membrane protein